MENFIFCVVKSSSGDHKNIETLNNHGHSIWRTVFENVGLNTSTNEFHCTKNEVFH